MRDDVLNTAFSTNKGSHPNVNGIIFFRAE